MGSASRAKSHATKLFGFLAILGLVVLGLFLYYVWLVMSDNLGTYHNTADLADLDGDGDLDVILHNVRTESEFTAFGGAGLWINQGDGQFVARGLEEGGGVGLRRRRRGPGRRRRSGRFHRLASALDS